MSGLTFNELGAKTANRYAQPIVHIEKVYINTNLALEATYSVFLKAVDGGSPTIASEADWFNHLKFYTLGIFNETYALNIVDKTEGTDNNSIRWQRLSKGDFLEGSGTRYMGIFDYFENGSIEGERLSTTLPYPNNTTDHGIHSVAKYGLGIPQIDPESEFYGQCQNYQELEFDWENPTTTFYDGDILIYKYSTVVTLEVFGTDENHGTTWEDLWEAIDTGVQPFEEYDSILSIDSENKNFTLFAFACQNWFDGTGFDEHLSSQAILENIGPIAYEKIFTDGQPSTEPQETFMLAGTPYEDVPLQTIGGAYHAGGFEMYQAIVDAFNTILDNYRTGSDQLVGITQSVDYILAVYVQDLLPKLNELRKSWPNKSATTNVGILYEKFNSLLYSWNRTLKQSELLSRRLTRNPKIIDNRFFVTGEATPTTYDDSIYPTISKYYISRSNPAPYADEDSEYMLASGYFFLDYEKVLMFNSVISRALDVGKILEWFGADFVTSRLVLEAVELKRMATQTTMDAYAAASGQTYEGIIGGISSVETGRTITTSLNTMRTMTLYTEGGLDDNGYGGSVPYVVDYEDGLDTSAIMRFHHGAPPAYFDWSYLSLRSFDLASEDSFDYRLMTFEFQDYYNYASAVDDPSDYENTGLYECYDVTFRMKDFTVEILDLLIDSYGSQLYQSVGAAATAGLMAPFQQGRGPLTEYVESAEEFCSYNNTDNFWNEFFINKMGERYTDPTLAPWNVAPVIYSFHLDLITNQFGGSEIDILTNAREISATISPTTGTLLELQTFYQKYQDLWDTYYGNTGELQQLVEGYWDYASSTSVLLPTPTTPIGTNTWPPTAGSITPHTLEYYVRLGEIDDPLPQIVTKTMEEYAAEVAAEEAAAAAAAAAAEEQERIDSREIDWLMINPVRGTRTSQYGTTDAGISMSKDDYFQAMVDEYLQEIYDMYCFVTVDINGNGYVAGSGPSEAMDAGYEELTYKFHIGRWWMVNILAGKDKDYNANTAKTWSNYYKYYDEYFWGADAKYKELLVDENAWVRVDPTDYAGEALHEGGSLVYNSDDAYWAETIMFNCMCYLWPNSQNNRGEDDGINWGNRLKAAGLWDDNYREWEGASSNLDVTCGTDPQGRGHDWSWFRMYAGDNSNKEDVVICSMGAGYNADFYMGAS